MAESILTNKIDFNKLFTEGKIDPKLIKYLPKPTMDKLFRLENIESCCDFMENNSIESFVEIFCNETLTKVYRLMLFSSEVEADRFFLYELRKAIERESIKRNFDCFQLIKQDKYTVIAVLYHQKQFVYLTN